MHLWQPLKGHPPPQDTSALGRHQPGSLHAYPPPGQTCCHSYCMQSKEADYALHSRGGSQVLADLLVAERKAVTRGNRLLMVVTYLYYYQAHIRC
jgi:hypothetical protein